MSIVVTTNHDSASVEPANNGSDAPVLESDVTSAPDDGETTEDSETSDDDKIAAKDGDESAKEGDQDEDDSEDSDESDESAPSDKKGQRRRNRGVRGRINKLNARISEKEREIEYWRQQALGRDGETRETKTPEKQIDLAQSATNRPDPDNYETQEEYLDALTDWKVEQKLAFKEKQEREIQLKTQYQTKVESFQKQVQDLKSKVADFDDVMADVDDVVVPITIQEAIFASPNAAQLAYEMAKDPEEFERICSLDFASANRAIGRIEARLEKLSESPKPKPKTTNAPKPMSSVKGGSSGATKKSIYDDRISFKEYERIRREQMAQKRSF